MHLTDAFICNLWYTFCQFCVFKLMTFGSIMLSRLYVIKWLLLSSNQRKALYHFVTLLCYWESAQITALLPALCVYKGFFTVSDWTGVKVREIKDWRMLLPRLYLSALITDIRLLCPSEQGDREKRMLERQREIGSKRVEYSRKTCCCLIGICVAAQGESSRYWGRSLTLMHDFGY